MATATLLRLLLPLLLLLLPRSLFPPRTVAAIDSISQTESLRDGDTLLSPNRRFALGFFSPGDGSTFHRYLGIWYPFSNQTFVWVANRRNPIPDSTGVLTLSANGTLLLFSRKTNTTFWTSEATTGSVAAAKPTARLHNSGNLVVSDISGSTMWQSFDHPTDTLLAGMTVGLNRRNGSSRFLSSWKSGDDPYPGLYTFKIEPAGGSYEVYVRRTDTGNIFFRTGRWDAFFFAARPLSSMYGNLFEYTFVSNENEAYYSFKEKNASTVSRLVMSPSGKIERMMWVRETSKWQALIQNPKDDCTVYETCGPNGMCSSEHWPSGCRCYDGYVPVEPELWSVQQYQNGCKRDVRELCGVGEGFRVVKKLKLPDTKNATVDYGKSVDECRDMCLRNCDCRAYAAANSSGGGGGTGCIIWEGDLIDSWRFPHSGQVLFLRAAASSNHERNVTAIAVTSPLAAALVIAILGALIWSKIRNNRRIKKGRTFSGILDDRKFVDGDLQCFDLDSIVSMTDNFADENKIGKGGFGSVYKGRDVNGRDVAVKRLADLSRQGLEEFTNEVLLIGKLQHRNLVRLLGFCITEEEKILVYEYMKNKSLDTFLFGEETSRAILDWRKRVDIVMGIARGILYLHHDSRLRIIHRDLKAGNVLLDEEMNPRISDFGTARLFSGDQLNGSTGRVIGTYGYMSPEYAMDGIYSVKSDVFSFGVLMLEIFSGLKNKPRHETNQDTTLLALAWRLWNEERVLELLDDTLTSTHSASQVRRHIQIALLCIQEIAEDRPTMSTVVSMLSNESSPLPQPKMPGFSKIRNTASKDFQSSESQSRSSVNEITLTKIVGR